MSDPDDDRDADPKPAGSSASTTAMTSSVGRDMAGNVSGFEMVGSVVFFSLAGVWLDRQFETTPLFILVLSALGLVGAVANVYFRYVRDMDRHEAEAAARKAAHRGGLGAQGPGADGPGGDRAGADS